MDLRRGGHAVSGLTPSARRALDFLARQRPPPLVVWCEYCGHVAADRRIQDGDDNCGRTLASGTPAECIEAMREAMP